MELPFPSKRKAFRVVRTLELIEELPDDQITIRIEIMESAYNVGFYVVRMWSLEHYRIQSTFPQENGVPAHPPSDELILKEFESFESPVPSEQHFDSVDDVETFVLAAFSRWSQSLGPSPEP